MQLKVSLELDFVMGSGFFTVFTKFVQSEFIFDIYRVFLTQIILLFANRALE